ncbi:hypothetical protein BV20DRAFT_941111 [Pilatotrama ljubarskyi]|nr:hypothetical protein BV20DRAFT_941111 [Pilatotrama ljubarskyi]
MEQWSMQSKKEARTRTLQKLRDVVQEHYGPQYSVHPFGSTCYGAGSWTSDVDVAIYDAERPYGIAPGDNRELPSTCSCSHLSALLKADYLRPHPHLLHAPARLTYPPLFPVKCRDPETGVSCDVNVNNRLGVYNTALIRQYCLRLPYLAALLRNVKAFIKSVDLNNPAQNDRGQPTSFSSYAITLMTIALLQNKGHAPNLQEDPELIVDTYFWENRFGLHRPLPVRFGRCRKWVRPASSPPMMQSWLQ